MHASSRQFPICLSAASSWSTARATATGIIHTRQCSLHAAHAGESDTHANDWCGSARTPSFGFNQCAHPYRIANRIGIVKIDPIQKNRLTKGNTHSDKKKGEMDQKNKGTEMKNIIKKHATHFLYESG